LKSFIGLSRDSRHFGVGRPNLGNRILLNAPVVRMVALLLPTVRIILRAFLSHSSKDSAVVETVARQLGGANVELDTLTFEHTVLSATAIQNALKRSTLFVLFLSSDTLSSPYVKFEELRAQQLLAAGVLERILIICLDDSAFAKLDDDLKAFNVVRKSASIQSIVRLIQHHLVLSSKIEGTQNKPFVGRQTEMNEAKNLLIDPIRAAVRALYVSGNAGNGRRTFARKLFSEAFPYASTIFPEIFVDVYDGPDEIYRKLIDVHTPIMTRAALRAYLTGFGTLSKDGKLTEIGAVLERIVASREAIFVVDRGGLLEDSGRLSETWRDVHSKLPEYPHPSVVFIAERRVPQSLRHELRDFVFSAIPALSKEESRQLLALSFRAKGITYDRDQLDLATEISDFHPFNIEILVASAKQYGLATVLADTSEIAHWKHRRGREFLHRVKFDGGETIVLAALRDLRVLDFGTLALLLDNDSAKAASALMRLMDFHIVEAAGDTYLVAPALRSAVERDDRFKLSPTEHRNMFKTVCGVLTALAEDDEFTVSTVDAAILASLQSETPIPDVFAAFLLPSHEVWLARRLYDREDYSGSIAAARNALQGRSRLSKAGLVDACRFLCLAAARLKRDTDFNEGLATLEKIASGNWAKSNTHFLRGFAARMKGFLPDAEREYKRSLDFSPGNPSAIRDLADVCLARGDADAAESYARRAYDVAPDNAYMIDILLSVLLNQSPSRRAKNQGEIDTLFDRLRQFGEDEDRSFYTTRRAEYELSNGNLPEASRLIDIAVAHTPKIFGVRALRAKIYLARRNRVVVSDELLEMQRILDDVNNTKGRSGVREMLEIKSEYLVECGDFAGAKRIYDAEGIFSDDEKIRAMKAIDFEQARGRH